MNGYRKMMMDCSENLGWCAPYIGKRVSIAIHEGEVAGLMIDGTEVEQTHENINKAAKIANPDYSEYAGWDDVHILLDGEVKESPCHMCPWFGVCDAMDNPDDWEDTADSLEYPDD